MNGKKLQFFVLFVNLKKKKKTCDNLTGKEK